jgi:hypothetical protein
MVCEPSLVIMFDIEAYSNTFRITKALEVRRKRGYRQHPYIVRLLEECWRAECW